MQRARNQLFSRSGFARNHDCQIGLGEARDDAIDFLHRGRTADHRQVFIVRGLLRGRFATRRRKRTLHNCRQFLQVERFGQIFISAAFGCRDGGENIVLRAHHHDRQFRAQTFDARQQVEDVFIRQHDIGDDEIAVALRNPAPKAAGI